MINIRERTADLLKNDFDLPREICSAMFDLGLIDERGARAVLIRKEYLRRINYKRKTDLKIYLAGRYCLSYSAIEKIVAGLNGTDTGH